MKPQLAVVLVLLAALGGSAFAQNNARMLSTPNAQTGTSYTFVSADTTRLVTFSNTNPVAVTLPSGATFGFGAGTMLSVMNLGTGQVTITCSSCTINGAATLALSQNSGADIYGGTGASAINYVALPSPTGANFAALGGNNVLTGNNTSGNFNAQFFVDGVKYSGCPAAVTAAGTYASGTVVIIPGTGPISECPTSDPSETIVRRNYDRTRDQCNGVVGSATPPCNAENYNYDDGNVMAGRRFEFTTNHQNLNGVSLGLYSITTLKNATANGSSGVDGFSAEADTAGTLTGSFGLQAHEANISVQSAGGTIANAYAVIGAVGTFNSSGNCVGSANCTALTNAIGIKGYGCRVPAGAVPVNCYGGYFLDQQSRASARSYSLGIEGKGLLVCTSSGCGLDAEDQSHVTHSFLFVDGTSTTSLQALSASQGINFLNSAGQLALNLGVSGLAKFSSVLVPNVAGNQDLGSIGLPFGNLFLGTAATNNFKFQPAATAAARTVSIPDPLTNVNLAFNIAATSAAFATATTAATCVQNTTAVTGATTAMVAEASPVSTPGVGAVWAAFVSSAGNVTITECAVAASAGGTIAFNIRVHP